MTNGLDLEPGTSCCGPMPAQSSVGATYLAFPAVVAGGIDVRHVLLGTSTFPSRR